MRDVEEGAWQSDIDKQLMPVRLLTRKVAMGLSFLWNAVRCSQAATAASSKPAGSRSAYLARIWHLTLALSIGEVSRAS